MEFKVEILMFWPKTPVQKVAVYKNKITDFKTFLISIASLNYFSE